MTIPKILEVDLSTGEQICREMNPDELKSFQEIQKIKLQELEETAKIAANKSALLDKMGLTADEAKLLLS